MNEIFSPKNENTMDAPICEVAIPPKFESFQLES